MRLRVTLALDVDVRELIGVQRGLVLLLHVLHAQCREEAAELVVGRAAVGPTAFSQVLRAPESSSALPPASAPNVVLIVLDTVRADHLEIYGYERKTMPNIARYADQATVYLASFSTSSWTLPSHASLFTGLSPRAHGAHGGSADSNSPGKSGLAPLPASRR